MSVGFDEHHRLQLCCSYCDMQQYWQRPARHEAHVSAAADGWRWLKFVLQKPGDASIEYQEEECLVCRSCAAEQAWQRRLQCVRVAPEWVSVATRLPEMRTPVLFTDGQSVYPGSFNHGDWYDDRCPDGHDARVQNVTHWRPWLEPPKDSK